jgi:hypothetical protein
MHWLEMLTHYNYEIHYRLGDKNCVADALSQRAELRPPDRADNIPQCLIPKAKFTKLAACEAEMTDSDWVDLTNVILAALAFSNEHLLSDTCRISQDWEDKLEGLVWDDRLGRKDGRIWIPEDEGLWKKVMRLYHDSLVTGHLGTSGTLELVLRSYWHRNLPDYVKRYVQGCHTVRAGERSIGISGNMESFSRSLLLMGHGSGSSLTSLVNCRDPTDSMPSMSSPIDLRRWRISFQR